MVETDRKKTDRKSAVASNPCATRPVLDATTSNGKDLVMNIRKFLIGSTLVMAAVVTFGTNRAEAATGIKTSCTVTAVAFDQHVFAQCSGDANNYFAYTTAESSACGTPTNVSIETLKIWQSMLMSALLSGRPVDIYYNTACNGGRGIFNLLLK